MKKRAFIILILIFFFVSLMQLQSFANGWDVEFDDTINVDNISKIGDGMNKVLGIFQIAGLSVGVIILIVIGIKWIVAAPSEKAEIKKNMIAFVVGAVLLFVASGIAQIVKIFSEEVV